MYAVCDFEVEWEWVCLLLALWDSWQTLIECEPGLVPEWCARCRWLPLNKNNIHSTLFFCLLDRAVMVATRGDITKKNCLNYSFLNRWLSAIIFFSDRLVYKLHKLSQNLRWRNSLRQIGENFLHSTKSYSIWRTHTGLWCGYGFVRKYSRC